MNRTLAIFAQAALAASAGLFVLSVYRFSDWDWRPVEEPFPGPGLAIAASAKITGAGKYRLEVIVPAKVDTSEVAMAEQPPIPCNVMLSLKGPEGFHAEQKISQLRHAGRFYAGKTDIYVAEPIDLIATGQYQVQVSNMGARGQLGERGAMLQFTRFQHRVESFLSRELVRGAGWLFFSVGLISAVASWRRGR